MNDQHVQEELLQQYFDGELAPASAADVSRHLEQCDPCSRPASRAVCIAPGDWPRRRGKRQGRRLRRAVRAHRARRARTARAEPGGTHAGVVARAARSALARAVDAGGRRARGGRGGAAPGRAPVPTDVQEIEPRPAPARNRRHRTRIRAPRSSTSTSAAARARSTRSRSTMAIPRRSYGSTTNPNRPSSRCHDAFIAPPSDRFCRRRCAACAMACLTTLLLAAPARNALAADRHGQGSGAGDSRQGRSRHDSTTS